MANKQRSRKTKAHPELGKFGVSVSSFGEIERTVDIDNINSFLNKNVADKKLSENQVDSDKTK